eukprot:14894089-Ditylum_brightwellii.AAC.1
MECEANKSNVKIKHILADNGVFKSAKFREHINELEQQISFCGVSVHLQNVIAERHIQTIVNATRTALLNAHVRWPEAIDMELWTFAFRHAVDNWNTTPQKALDYRNPDEVFSDLTSRSKPRNQTFNIFLPFGCPVYILDKTITDGKKPPKWDPCSQVGIFLGYSRDHARNVAWVLNPTIDHISAQNHVIYDDMFTTVTVTTDADKINLCNGVLLSHTKHIDIAGTFF